jgi:hypothetical protein
MTNLNLDMIKKKVARIKEIQQRRVEKGETYHSVGDALALNIYEAEFLLRIINDKS